MKIIKSEKLTSDAFKDFGKVLGVETDRSGEPVNQGRGKKYELGTIFPHMNQDMKVYSSLYYMTPSILPFQVSLFERHPDTPQIFISMGKCEFMTAVAQGDEKPDLKSVRVFRGTENQGICYEKNVWHTPLVALNQPSAFFCQTVGKTCSVVTEELEVFPFLME